MGSRALFLAALASAALLTVIAPATSSAVGTATVVADQEPTCLNPLTTCANSAWATWSAGVAIPGAFRVTPGFDYEPMLVDHVDVEHSPFALTYHLRDAAVWSDGTPVSADDLLFTQAVITDPSNTIRSRSGHELVVAATKLGPKVARFVFSEPYAPWRSLFAAILPKHALEGSDFDTVWQTQIVKPSTSQPIGAGPFLLTAWTGGQSLTLSRNPLWWGPHAPSLDSITVKFIPNANNQFQAMIDGTGDVLTPSPALQIAELRTRPELVVQTDEGQQVHHIDFNTASSTMPLLGQLWFRQAVAHALDRDSLFPLLYGDISPNLGTQQSLSFPQASAFYRPSFAAHDYSAAAVTALMQSHSCVLGGDSVWSCGGVRASIKLATTTGNPARALAQQQLVTRAAAAGIKLVPDNSSTGILFGTRLPAGQYELAYFSWVPHIDGVGQVALYGCGGGSNWLGYCSTPATQLLTAAQAEVDAGARAELVNDANDVIAGDVPTLPLYRDPAFLVSRATLQGPRNNPAGGGSLWNTEDWFRGSFADVPPSNPFYSYIEDLLSAGITTGCGTNAVGRRLYCPADFVPRQQMAAFLIRAKGLTQLFPATPSFVDVPTSNPFFGYIERLKEQGITTGCNPPANDRFCPADFVPRQQMAAFLIRAKGLAQLFPATPSFADVPASNPFFGYIERLKEQAITTGCNPPANNFYCPLDNVPRQQMAAFLIRAFG